MYMTRGLLPPASQGNQQKIAFSIQRDKYNLKAGYFGVKYEVFSLAHHKLLVYLGHGTHLTFELSEIFTDQI